MKFCRFCGKELVNGQCDCKEFQAEQANNTVAYSSFAPAKDPFLRQNFKPDFTSVSTFISSVRDQAGMTEVSENISDPYEYNLPIVPNCIQPEENEVVVKQYNIAKLRTRLKFMKAEGRLMITNRRVLFRAAGTSVTGNILQEHQFNVDEIGGIEMHKDYKFSILNLLGCILLCMLSYFIFGPFSSFNGGGAAAIGVILGILGLLPTFIVYKRFWLKFLCACVGGGFLYMAEQISSNGFIRFLTFIACIVILIDLIIVCFVPNLVIKIKTKGANGAVVIGSQKTMFMRQTGDDYTGFAEVMPWEDTIMAMNEVGTMIDDLQKNGDYAIEKWAK